MRRVLVILALLCATANAQDAGTTYIDPHDLYTAPTVSAAASPSEVQLGARVVLVVTAVYDDGVTVNLPQPLDLGGAFEERPGKRISTDSVRADGKKVREWQVELYAWDLGDQEIPPVQVTYVAAGTAAAVQTNPVPVKVVGQLGDMVDTAQPRDLAPPVPLWRRTWLWVLIGSGILLAIIAAIVTIVIVRRRRRRPVRVTAPISVRLSGVFRRPRLGGPAEEALARLEAIDSSGMLERDRKVAYTEMIDVIQVFLGRQLGHDTEDMTGGELRDWVSSTSKLGDPQRGDAARWLDEAELVKFGGLAATVDEGRAHIAAARDVVISIAAPAHASQSMSVEEVARA